VRLRLSLGALSAALILVAVSLIFSTNFAVGALIGVLISFSHLLLVARTANRAVTRGKPSGFSLLSLSFAKIIVTLSGLLFAARFGIVAVIGIFPGVLAALTGAAIAGIIGEKNAPSD